MTAPVFADPGRSGGAQPRGRNLVGRTCVWQVTSVDRNAKGLAGEKKTNVYANLMVLDGGPLEYGDNQSHDPSEQRPATHRVDTPAYFPGVIIGESEMVRALADLDPTFAQNSLCLGVVVRGTTGNFPFMITKVGMNLDKTPRPDAAERTRRAASFWAAFTAGTWTPPVPVEIRPSAPQGTMAQYVSTPVVETQTPPQFSQGQQPAPAVDPAYAAWLASQRPSVPPAPAGWPVETWKGLTDPQRAQILASLAPTNANDAPPF